MAEPLMHISMLVSADDDAEAVTVLNDLLEHLKARLEFWGYGMETHSPISLLGEVLTTKESP